MLDLNDTNCSFHIIEAIKSILVAWNFAKLKVGNMDIYIYFFFFFCFFMLILDLFYYSDHEKRFFFLIFGELRCLFWSTSYVFQ